MKICPKCQRSAKVSERIETDKKTKKNWLITFCAKCGYNYEIDEYLGKVLSPQDEMDKYQWKDGGKANYWP